LRNATSFAHNEFVLRKLKKTLAHLFHPKKSNSHRAKLLHPEALFVLFLLAASVLFGMQLLQVAPGNLRSVLGFASSISVQDVVDQTNAQRSAQGLAPLTLNGKLSSAAMSKGSDMIAQQYWAHTSPTGVQPWYFIKNSGYSYTVAGENLARDFSNTSDMMQAWMGSPTHRENIVSSKYKEIGVAVINGQLEGYDTTLVVQMFGAPRQQAATVATKGEAQTTKPDAQVIGKVKAETTTASPTPTPSPTPTSSATPAPEEMVQTQDTVPEAGAEARTTKDPSQKQLISSSFLQLSSNDQASFSPLLITKAVFLAIGILIMFTLLYDFVAIGHRSTARVVGKNIAHFLLLGVVMYLILFFKSGVIG